MPTKRVLDCLIVCASAPLTIPLGVIVAALVRIRLGTPVFYSQMRPGLGGQPFRMYKFRSMGNARDSDGQLSPDAERLGNFGRLLRSTSLDELPELWNVLRGDMSLVGPRPLLMEYLELYSAEQLRRHDVRPGVTGWAQINGRNAVSWNRKFQLDVWYVDNQSVWLDMKILAITALRVLRRDGVSADGEATMPRFMGSGESSS